ncbi:hypothetical protein D9M71_807310 [compost metagenome]
MGVDEAQHGARIRRSQAVEKTLHSGVISDHFQLVDHTLPAILPLIHQSSSRFERTHSTWRLIRKLRYKGIFLAA